MVCLATSKQFGLCGVLDIRAELGEVGTRDQKEQRHRRNAEEFGLNFFRQWITTEGF